MAESLLQGQQRMDYGTLSGGPHEPQVLRIDLNKVSALLEVSQEDLIETLSHGQTTTGEELHVTSAQMMHGSLPAAAAYTDAKLGTHLCSNFRASAVDMHSIAEVEMGLQKAASIIMRLSTHSPASDARHEHGRVIALGHWHDSASGLSTVGSLSDLHRVESLHKVESLQRVESLHKADSLHQFLDIPHLGHFRSSMMDVLSPSHPGSRSDIAALFAVPQKKTSLAEMRLNTAFIVGSPGSASALVFPEVEDIIGADRHWELPSAMAEACLVVESDGNQQPHVYAYIRYVRPLVAWFVLTLGWFCYSAIGPIYSYYPMELQQASFRVAAWRNLAALGPFALLFLLQTRQHGLSGEHKAFLLNYVNWPLLLAGSMGSFWASTTTLMAFGYTSNFPLVAVLSSMHPYLILLWEKATGKPLSLTTVAVLFGGAVGTSCMVVSDAFQSLFSLAICAVASCFLVMYVKSNYKLQALLPFPCLMSINFGMGSAMGLIGTFAFEGTTLDNSPQSLLWVFFNESTFWITLFLSISYMCGIAAFVACGKHIPVLVISVAIAMEPESSVLFEALIGGTALPHGLLLLGIAMITITKLWLALVSFWERKKEVIIDVTEAVESSMACFSEIPDGR